MADDDKSSNDVQDEITAVLGDDSQDTPADPSPAKPEAKAEDKKPEVAKDTKEEKKGDDTPAPPEVPTKGEEAKPDKEEAKAEPEDEAESTEDKPRGKAEERKAQLNTEIRDLVSQRNALKEQVTKANAEVYQPATENELTGETNPETGQPFTSTEAKVEAMRQAIEMRDYNEKVAEAQLTIESESQRVLTDFPIFNSENEGYDKELAEEAAELLQANLILDPNTGQVIGSNVSPYQLYKTLARASGISTVKGQIKGQQATEKMLANADGGSAAAPPAKAKDPVLEILSSDDY